MVAERLPAPIRKAVEAYVNTHTSLEKLEPEYKELVAKDQRIQEQLYNLMDEFGFKSIRIDGVGLLIKAQRGPYCAFAAIEGEPEIVDGGVPETSREVFVKSARELGLYDVVVKEMPVMQRVNSIVGQRLKSGEPLFQGLDMRWVHGVTWRDRPEDKKKPTKKGKQKVNGNV